MAFLRCDFFSEVLGLSSSIHVLLPQVRGADPAPSAAPFPTLWLLHGLSDDHTIWTRRTSLERYVEGRRLAVVMPAVHRSYYTDQVAGNRYFTYVAEELPRICRGFFPLSDRRADNFVAGLSMGGYGAFKLAFHRPHQYAAAASLSGALDLAAHASLRAGQDPFRETELTSTFGPLDKLPGGEHDLLALARRAARRKVDLPRLYACCGTEDFLYQDNQTFLALARKLKLDFTYEEGPGAHEWGYWDRLIQRVLDWLPLPGAPRPGA